MLRIAKDSTPLDRMSRLIKHLMQQRSFYPLSPPQTTEIPLDYGHLKSAELPLLPDIMILPSRLATFVKV
jgi:DNA polymerase alpha subunit B